MEMGGGVCRCEAVIVEAAEVGWREDVVPVGGGGTQAVASAHAHCGACGLTTAAGCRVASHTLTGCWNWAVCPERSCNEGRGVECDWER